LTAINFLTLLTGTLRPAIMEDMVFLIAEYGLKHPMCQPHRAFWESDSFKSYSIAVKDFHDRVLFDAKHVPRTIFETVRMEKMQD
jgi:hypothetical protein